MRIDFSGSRALILGGSSELGSAVAAQLIREGVRPLLTWHSSAGKTRIHARLGLPEDRYQTFYLDLDRIETVRTLFQDIRNDLDYLVDCAHGEYERLIASADHADVSRYFAENVSARSEVLKLAARAMLAKRKGRMVYVSSVAAENPNPGQGFYAASKLASEALYRSMGLELKDRGIAVCCLRPGYVDIGRGARYLASRRGEGADPEHGVKVFSVKEVSETILFLLSDQAIGLNLATITMGRNQMKIQ